METTFSMFSPVQSRTMQSRMAFPEPPKPKVSLTEKYRPKSLTDLVGQGAAVLRLLDFTDAPYPSAWIFAGPTGVGKTSAARALAYEMGICPNWGLNHIESGDCNDERLCHALDLLRYHCMGGSGWKLVLIDEADMMSTKAKQRCLSALESLPDQCLIIFTTNNAEKFDQRFRDRCEVVEFSGDPETLSLDAQALLDDVWRREGLPGDPFAVSSLPDLVADGAVSFRRVVRAVEMATKGWRPSPVQQTTKSKRKFA